MDEVWDNKFVQPVEVFHHVDDDGRANLESTNNMSTSGNDSPKSSIKATQKIGENKWEVHLQRKTREEKGKRPR
ncbi:hypothetical protein Nepgr_005467 [Nepenthes gracilis]|uniref:Uncharacterized protein n=1 Tax=Nepenthes gracilis TaxID=150966 RepID=A0AAD3XGH4_NEPGR|nr:hypothetical protein Nepgr_005467 [Nepenthes gracilis]